MKYQGSFDSEPNILKRYARRGQCFSTSRFILKLVMREIDYSFEDIKRNGYVFTDGCGEISPELA
jgi:RNA-dependent RNA polymerase